MYCVRCRSVRFCRCVPPEPKPRPEHPEPQIPAPKRKD